MNKLVVIAQTWFKDSGVRGRRIAMGLGQPGLVRVRACIKQTTAKKDEKRKERKT